MGNAFALCLCAAQDCECFYCGAKFTGPALPRKPASTQWTRDHVLPRSRGGSRPWNMILACQRCNLAKGQQQPTEEQITRSKEVYAKALLIYAAFYGEASASNLTRTNQTAAA